MRNKLLIRADDPRLKTLKFTGYINSIERRVVQFLPGTGEPQFLEVTTPWGAVLTAKKGDYLVSEVEKPDDRWPVDREIFENTYLISRPGFCLKKAITDLVPLVDLTCGDPEQMVDIETLEGLLTVRAGDFYLARGIKGEIWPYPKDKLLNTLIPAPTG